jgi:hypothetical protein
MSPQYQLLISGIVGVVTGSVLSTIGNVVASSIAYCRERKQQAKDNKRAEYRELLGVLSQSAHCFADNSPGLLYEIAALSPEQRQKAQEAHRNAQGCIEDRLSIAGTMERERILERWQLLTAKTGWTEFWVEWGIFHSTLIALAQKDLGEN